MSGEDGTVCGVATQGVSLELVQSFEYLECGVNESGTDDADIESKVAVCKWVQLRR